MPLTLSEESCRRRCHLSIRLVDDVDNDGNDNKSNESDDEEKTGNYRSPIVMETEKEKNSPSLLSLSSSSSSASTSRSEIERERQNAIRSLISNIIFLLGSALFLAVAIWDLPSYIQEEEEKEAHENDDDDDDDDYDDDDDEHWFQDAYTLISIIGALLLVLNAAVDLVRAYYFHKQQQHHQEHEHDDDAPNSGRLRNGDPKWDAFAAIAFGLAAMIDFANVFVDYYEVSNELGIHLTMASSHLYLLNALIALSGYNVDSTHICSCPSSSSRASITSSCRYFIHDKFGPSFLLEKFGDILFFVGSFIDVVISYISDPELSSVTLRTIGGWDIASSVLWVLDAIFYIISDTLLMTIYYDCPCCYNQKCRRRRATRGCRSLFHKCCKGEYEMQENQYSLLDGEEGDIPSHVQITSPAVNVI